MNAVRESIPSYWPADPSQAVLDVTLGDLLRQVASEVPDRIALVEGGTMASERRRWTYRELLEGAECAARALLGRFAPGERVAVWAPNCAEWIFLQHGASLAGIVLVTVNPAFLSKELEHVLRTSGASGIFHVDTYRKNDMKAGVEAVRPRLPGLRHAISFSSWDRFLAEARPDVLLPRVSPGDTVQIQYTSGTTGFPKGACLHHRGIVNASRYVALRAEFPVGGVWVNAMPLFHVGGCAVTEIGALAQRGTFVLLPAFDAGEMLEILESERGNIALLVPTMILAMLEHPDCKGRDLSSLQTVLSGAAVVPAALVRRTMEAFGCAFSILFGQTEGNGVFTQTRLTDSPVQQAETVGTPLPCLEMKIGDPLSGEILPAGVPGEICVRGYQAMTGYWDMPEATALALRDEGWLHTGDMGMMDGQGYLRVTGRLKDMIIRGGENIYPREIEDVLVGHPAVGDATVVGVPDERWGEVVVAIIRPASPQSPPAEDELRGWCRGKLAAYKTPVVWHFVEAFPLTASGKIRKHVLREQLRSGELVTLPVPVEAKT
ncbi:AMP-binding protein [Variovorax sp. dw_308]|uniref:AMP-binding protein n=1 Tax=Variovorax sp. dw_308 TaxID=2721546 RepID=UPI001C4940C9|nr:AMP-binding protein [Variovorax sp. dw_308]